MSRCSLTSWSGHHQGTGRCASYRGRVMLHPPLSCSELAVTPRFPFLQHGLPSPFSRFIPQLIHRLFPPNKTLPIPPRPLRVASSRTSTRIIPPPHIHPATQSLPRRLLLLVLVRCCCCCLAVHPPPRQPWPPLNQPQRPQLLPVESGLPPPHSPRPSHPPHSP